MSPEKKSCNFPQNISLLHVPGEKHRVIDHDEILRRAPLLVDEHHVAFHSQHLDGQSSSVRDGIELDLPGRVGEPDHCRVGAVVPKKSLGKFVRQVRQHPELAFRVAMRFDMNVRAKLAGLRLAPRQDQLHRFDHPLDIFRLIHRDRFDVVRVRQRPRGIGHRKCPGRYAQVLSSQSRCESLGDTGS